MAEKRADAKCPSCGAPCTNKTRTGHNMYACGSWGSAEALASVSVRCVRAAKDVEIDRLRGQLEAIRRKWVDGIGQLDRPWRVEMAGLVGDVGGLQEAAGGPDARIRELARKTLEAAKEHSDG